jgi:adenylylsulfate kinase
MKKYNDKKGLVIWLTGLPCSGKTTISKELEKYFKENKLAVQRLDGDDVRKTICNDLGFSKRDRERNIERIAYIARMLAENKINVIIALVSPYLKSRELARKICPNFIEIFVNCDPRECIRRDTKDMYRNALEGRIKNFTGIQDKYEKPSKPEIMVETDKNPLKYNVSKITNYLKKCAFLFLFVITQPGLRETCSF